MDWLTAKINKEFENKFSFLKLLEVKYNKIQTSCLISFLYPENKLLTEVEKQTITEYIKKGLAIAGDINVKFKKSYLDDNLISKSFFDILKKDFPSAYGFADIDTFLLTKDFNSRNISIKISEDFLDYINENKLKQSLKESMEQLFCSEFFISLIKGPPAKEVSLSQINSRLFKQAVPRYQVKLARNLFGGEVAPSPEYIKNVKSEKKSVILAGKIENFEKKSYEVKKGKTKGQQKYYFAFELNDTTSKIDVRYFTTKSNEKEMDKLLNNDEVLVLGDIKEFNKRFTLYVRAISRCKLPEKIELVPVLTNDYEVVSPTTYSILSQENLFKKATKYSDKILSNSYIVFDVETTGLNYETDELLEIGAVKIENGRIVSKFQSLIKPINPIPLTATEINNITDSMVANSPSLDVVIRDFYRYTRGCEMVGYNVSFDQKFILEAAKKQSIIFDNNFIDALPLARDKLRLTRYKLTDVVKRLEITLDGAHRALADALATAEVFLKLNSAEFV